MDRIENDLTTIPAGNDNLPAFTLGRLHDLLARHATELRAVAPTPFLQDLVSRMAVQAIRREMRA